MHITVMFFGDTGNGNMIAKMISEQVAKRVEDVAHTFALDEVRYQDEEGSKRYLICTAEGTLVVEKVAHPLAEFLSDTQSRGLRRDPSQYRIRFSGTDLVEQMVPNDFAAAVFRDGGHQRPSEVRGVAV